MPWIGLRVIIHQSVSILTLVVLCSCGRTGDTSSSAGPASPSADAGASAPPAGGIDAPAVGTQRLPPIETGLLLFRQGDLKGAEPYLAVALKSAPRDRRLLETLGSIYARSDRRKQAEDSFRAALAVEPASIARRHRPVR